MRLTTPSTDLLFVTLLATALTLFHATTAAETADTGLLTVVSDGNHFQFNVEVVDTPETRAQGLQGRQTLAEDAGMLFLLEYPQKVRMWMRNTLIPLDMLFIDSEGLITKIAARTTPFSLTPIAADTPVIGILELPGGSADRLGIHPGDLVIHPAFGNLEHAGTPDR